MMVVVFMICASLQYFPAHKVPGLITICKKLERLRARYLAVNRPQPPKIRNGRDDEAGA